MADSEGRLSPCMDDFEDEALDPRIQGELERLNRASEEINRLELELDDARASFRQALSDSTHKLDSLAKKLGSNVEKARPYYDARLKSKEVHVETQKAAYQYERACSMHEAAKEMVQLAEQGYMQREDSSDAAWQEMLNHATMKVNDAEMERLESEKVHQRTMNKFKDAEERVQKLQKDLKRAINKSRPYFEMKAKFNQMMEDRKKSVTGLESSVNDTKKTYSEALRNLEEISEEIHRQRLEMKNQAELGIRGAGVGSESPSPPPMRGKDPLSIDGQKTHLASTDISQTTATSTQSSNHNVGLPSVIYSSPEKARSRSYRQAIETPQTSSDSSVRQILDSINEDYRVNLDDEYMSLPTPSSSDGKISGYKTGDDLVFDNSHYELKSPRRDSKSGDKIGEVTPMASSEAMQSPPLPSQYITKKPASKLKGLILLPVGAGQDPLQANIRITTTSSKPSSKIVRQRTDPTTAKPSTYPYSHNKVAQNLVSPTSHSHSNSKTESTYTTTKDINDKSHDEHDDLAALPKSSSEKSIKRLLKVPSYQDLEEGSVSDNESITSGTMLDDDQVEFLTMEFSEHVVEDTDEVAEDNDWRMMSLPANLSHLENYIRRFSDTHQPGETVAVDDQPEVKETESDVKQEEELDQSVFDEEK